MKAFAFTLLALLSVACNSSPKYENHLETKPSKVYTISCEIGGEWISFQTLRHPTKASVYRSGVWKFLTTDRKWVLASNCSAVIEGE